MDIQFLGANCISLANKGVRIVVDDTLADMGLKNTAKAGDVLLYTGVHGGVSVPVKLVIDTPGEYEVSDVSISGIPARAHMDEPGTKLATMYKIIMNDLSILCVGHVYPELNQEQLEAIGTVDVLVVPVGGNGYTLDSAGALAIIKEIEPKLVIPTHYADKAINYPVPQQTLEQALKDIGMEVQETTAKLKLKLSDLTEVTQLIVLERS